MGGPEHEGDERLLLPAGVLTDMTARPARLVIPDPDAPGPSHGRVLAPALSLMRRGVLPGEGVIRCADHVSTLILYADEPLVRALSYRVLAPLAGIPVPQRDRLAETLLAWLQSESSVGDTALRLHVHPQTVRYRMRQLEKLFGEALRDSETRFELELALRADAFSGPPREHSRPVPESVRPSTSA